MSSSCATQLLWDSHWISFHVLSFWLSSNIWSGASPLDKMAKWRPMDHFVHATVARWRNQVTSVDTVHILNASCDQERVAWWCMYIECKLKPDALCRFPLCIGFFSNGPYIIVPSQATSFNVMITIAADVLRWRAGSLTACANTYIMSTVLCRHFAKSEKITPAPIRGYLG